MPRKSRIDAPGALHYLSDSDFVDGVLAGPQEEMEKRYKLRSPGYDLDKVVARVTELTGVQPEEVLAKGRYRHVVEARSLFCNWAVRELGVPMSSLSRRLAISIPAVSKSVLRGRNLAAEKGYSLLKS
ncbi:MAG: hypothetical protein ABIK83_00875 [Candidatus Zixiibacteriota bacterium]